MDTKWFVVSLTAVKMTVKRRGKNIYSGSLPIRDVLAGCRGGKNCEQKYVMLQRQKNGTFTLFEVGMLRFLDSIIWKGESAREVEAEVFKILLEKYKIDEGWTNHRVLVRPIGDEVRDAMAWPFLRPILEGSIMEVGELREQVGKIIKSLKV